MEDRELLSAIMKCCAVLSAVCSVDNAEVDHLEAETVNKIWPLRVQ